MSQRTDFWNCVRNGASTRRADLSLASLWSGCRHIGKVNFARYGTLLKWAHVQLVAECRSKRRQLRAVNECREALPSRWPWSNRSAVPSSLTSEEHVAHTDTLLHISLICFPGVFSKSTAVFFVCFTLSQTGNFTITFRLSVVMLKGECFSNAILW